MLILLSKTCKLKEQTQGTFLNRKLTFFLSELFYVWFYSFCCFEFRRILISQIALFVALYFFQILFFSRDSQVSGKTKLTKMSCFYVIQKTLYIFGILLQRNFVSNILIQTKISYPEKDDGFHFQKDKKKTQKSTKNSS